MTRPFPVNPTLTGIALAYTNAEMIADRVLPYATPVATEVFNYLRYGEGEAMTVPDTAIGRRSTANTIEVTATEEQSRVIDHALSDLVPLSDIDNAPNGYDPKAHATETVTELMVLRREVDVAALVFNPASYAAGHKVQLAGPTQFSHADADPFQAMWDALEVPIVRPNVGVIGRSVWNKVATHPKLIAKLYGAASQRGKARLEDLAAELEIQEIIVGAARVNTAKKGQPIALTRAWGNHLAFIHRNTLANNQRGMTFGMTVPHGEKFATREIPEEKIGKGGSLRIQVEDSRKELITAPNAGYFFQDAIA